MGLGDNVMCLVTIIYRGGDFGAGMVGFIVGMDKPNQDSAAAETQVALDHSIFAVYDGNASHNSHLSNKRQSH